MALVIRALPTPLYLHRLLTNLLVHGLTMASLHHFFSFVSVSVLGTRFQTHVCKRTLNPVFNAKDATFDFPIYLSVSDKLGVIEFVLWDKDVLKKDYLGEFALPLDEWFKGNAFGFEDQDNQACPILLSKFYSIREISPNSIVFLRQPHILTRDDPCYRHHGHQNRLCPSSQCHV
jgi:hypothetical protein